MPDKSDLPVPPVQMGKIMDMERARARSLDRQRRRTTRTRRKGGKQSKKQ